MFEEYVVISPSQALRSAVMPLKHRKATVTLSPTKNPAPGMLDHPSRLEDQLLHHRLCALVLGCMADRRIRLVQSVLPNQTQQIYRRCGELADLVVDVKLARGLTLQIHIALDLPMLTWGFAKLLPGGVIEVQRNDLSRADALWQRRRPAFGHVLGRQQDHSPLVAKPQVHDGALNEPVDAPGRVGSRADPGRFQTLLPNALPLVKAIKHPLCAGIGHPQRSNRLDRCSARVPLDDEGVRVKVLDGVEVILSQTQQGQVAFENLAVGAARANREGWINRCTEMDALGIFVNEGQTGMRTQVVGQLFDYQVGLDISHLQGEQHFTPKSLIYKNKSTFIYC